MIVLYLIVAHLAGDFLVQTRWQSARKLGWSQDAIIYRTRHVVGYTMVFTPLAAVYADSTADALLFLLGLFVLHWLTDSRRFVNTPAEWLWWRKDRDRWPLKPNPWPALPIVIDQTLHLTQIAILGGLLL